MSVSTAKSPSSGFTVPIVLVIIAAATILSISMGIRQSLGLFLPPINAELGVSASAFGFALALQSLIWGISQPFVGALGDRFGARPVVIGCAAIYALGLLLMAWGKPILGLNAGAGLMVGIGIAGTGFGVLFGAVARIVPADRRVQTLGMVSAAGSLATLLIAPLGQYLIVHNGWRVGAIAFVLISLLMAVLGVMMGPKPAEIRTEADQEGSSIRDSLLAAARHPGFVAMTIAFFACGFQLMYITVHLPAFLAFCGVPPTISATALGVIGLGNAAGSLLAGYLGARYSQKRLLALAYLLRTITIICFVAMPVTPASTIVFAATMGVLWLGVVPLVSGLIVKLFGLQHFNTLFGFAFLSHQVGAFIGSWLGGLSFDVTGSYTVAWGSMILIGACAFLLQWFMDDQPRPSSGGAGLALPATT
ncbi:MFS transporter [Methylocystis sp. 9N]|uniref:MFS transporter n=1 Tax=Methylocystis borbori TaxID=3118750 RepID=A0ABU7XDR0_9HYPH